MIPARLRSGAALLLLFALGGCKQDLYSRLSEQDANAMLSALYSIDIAASKHTEDGKSWSVRVEEHDLQRAVHAVQANGLPRQPFTDTGELFKKEGLVSTPSEERIRYIYAVSQELARTLSEIDGVVSARVHPVIPANDPLASRVRPSSASVFIKHRPDANLQAMAPAIRNLVMRGIEGLEYENIALTFVVAEDASLKSSVPDPRRPAVARASIDPTIFLWIAAGALGVLAVRFISQRVTAAMGAAWSSQPVAAPTGRRAPTANVRRTSENIRTDKTSLPPSSELTVPPASPPPSAEVK